LSWLAVFTLPKNEHSVARHLDRLNVSYFLPTYESTRVWKNRQRVTVSLPLFPTYLFVHIPIGDRWRVLSAPGVVRIVSNSKGPILVDAREIHFIRVARDQSNLEPFDEIPIGRQVRITSGAMTGVEGILIRRKGGGTRLVLSLQLINMHAAVEVDGQHVEPV